MLQTVDDNISSASKQSLSKVLFFSKVLYLQVLQYMRTDTPVGGKAVLTVVLNDVPCLTYPIPHINNAVTSGRYSANFLLPGVESAIVKRGDQSTRR